MPDPPPGQEIRSLPIILESSAENRLSAAALFGSPMPRPLLASLLFAATLGAPCISPGPASATDTWSPLPNGYQRLYHRAIYDSLRARMVVFGGVDSLYRNDVWTLSLSGASAWTQLSPGGFPVPATRDSHGLVYDPLRDRMLIFGGASHFGQTELRYNDVWALSLGASPAWSSVSPTGTKPIARHSHTVIYDPVRDRLVVFGGRDGVSYRNDVWALSLSGTPAWTQLTPTGTPPTPRGGHSAIYDPVRDRMIVFAGFDGLPTWVNDVWELTFSPTLAWNQITPGLGAPTPRHSHSAIYDPVGDRMIIFGGRDNTPDLWRNDVWAMSLAGTPVWTELTPSGGPPGARYGQSGIYDAAATRLVIFGGTGTPGFYFDDAWALSLGPAVAVEDTPAPGALSMVSAGPNPARSTWALQFRLAQTADVSLRIYNPAGRVVRHLWRGLLDSGAHSLVWNGRSDSGERATAGIYFYELRGAGSRLARAFVVLD